MLYSHIFTLVLLVLTCTLAEEKKSKDRIDEFLRPPGTSPEITSEAPSYFSRLSSWLFPGDDQIPKTSDLKIAQPRLEYRDPNPSGHDHNCNLCNKEPWVPVVSNYGSKTMIGFVQPSEIKQTGGLYGAPLQGNLHGNIGGQYGVPPVNSFEPPAQQYGPPPAVNIEPPAPHYGSPPGPPPALQYGPPPGPPPASHYGPPPGPPPPAQYGPPPGHPPAPQYGPPPGPPPVHQYGPPHGPPSSQYGPPPGPSPGSQYGSSPIKYGPPRPLKPFPRPPLSPSKYGPPKFLPKPPTKYGPPIFPGLLPPRNPPRGFGHNPPSKYGPPAFSGPLPNYGPPSKHAPHSNYGPPTIPVPHSEYGPPIQPHKEYGPPLGQIKPHSEYGSPSIGLEQPPIPQKDYGPPFVGPSAVPHAEYGPPNTGPPQIPLAPQSEYGPPNPTGLGTLSTGPAINAPISNYGVPPAPVHEPQEIKSSLPSGPSAISNNFGLPQNPLFSSQASIDFRAPSVNYQPPPNNPALSYGPPDIQIQNIPEQQKIGVTDSYGPPPSGPVLHANHLKPTSEEYRPPAAAANLPLTTGSQENTEATHLFPSAQGSILQPIPFPNLSQDFVAPLHNAQNFQSSSDQVIQDILQHKVKEGIEVVPSVPVTDFISSVQYPTQIIQSPLIDLATDSGKSFQGSNAPTSYTNQNSISFNAKPIVVDEHHSEATDTHHAVTLQNDTNTFKRDSENVLGNLQSLENGKNGSSVGEASLQKILNSDESLGKAIASHLLGQEIQPKPFETTGSPEDYEKSLKLFNHHAFATNEALFTPPPMDNSTWTPSFGITTSIQPPPLQLPTQHTWIQKVKQRQPYTTKNPKQIQIIVPYITENEWTKNVNQNPSNPPHNPPLSLFMKLPQLQDSQWAKYINLKDTNDNENPISSITDLLKDTNYKVDNPQHLPFDILKLQKNIDVWTEQEYNNGKDNDLAKASTSARFNYSKQIPDEYLTTPFDSSRNEITTELPKYYDYLASGSNRHSVETNITENEIIESNTIGVTDGDETLPTTTPIILTSTSNVRRHTNSWEKIAVSISPITNERVYVVTPQPWSNQDSTTPESAWIKKKDSLEESKLTDKFTFTSPRFTKRPEPIKLEKKDETNKTVHFVYSDWPKLINSLLTSTEEPQTTSHPLFGNMELTELTTTEETPTDTIQTISGHSKVSGTTLPTVASKKKSTGEEKKQNFKTTTEKVL